MTRRAIALVLLHDGWTCQEVADAFFLDDDTIRGWHKLFEQRGIAGITSFAVGDSASDLTTKQEDDLKAWVGVAPPGSTRQTGARIEKEFGLVLEASLPKLSVVITSYNYSRFIIEAIKSVQQQSYSNFECLIVDDCSTDDSFWKISNFIAELKDQRFRCIRLGKNQGQIGAIKAGIENISGSFVTLMDADDVLAKDFLKTHLEVHLIFDFINRI